VLALAMLAMLAMLAVAMLAVGAWFLVKAFD